MTKFFNNQTITSITIDSTRRLALVDIEGQASPLMTQANLVSGLGLSVGKDITVIGGQIDVRNFNGKAMRVYAGAFVRPTAAAAATKADTPAKAEATVKSMPLTPTEIVQRRHGFEVVSKEYTRNAWIPKTLVGAEQAVRYLKVGYTYQVTGSLTASTRKGDEEDAMFFRVETIALR